MNGDADTAVDFDPTTLDGWSEADDVCDVTLTVTIGDAVYGLRCEQDSGHELPHGGTVWWSDNEAQD